MEFSRESAEVFVPDGTTPAASLARTTHLAVGAHQDDLEIIATEGILTCFKHPDQWFTGVVATDGRGSPRAGRYAAYGDEEMRRVRFEEQRTAALVGGYSAQIFLDHPSASMKDGAASDPVADLAAVLRATRPEVVYTHALTDKHDTHVAVTLRLIEALRSLPAAERPRRVLGSEVWRDLDWMMDDEKVCMDTSAQENLQAALLGVFDSQIAGGKRYDLAIAGRRRANATFFASHSVDTLTAQHFAMNLTPLLADENLAPAAFADALVQRFARDVAERIARLD